MTDQTPPRKRMSRRSILAIAVLGTGVTAASYRYLRETPDYRGAALSAREAHEEAVAGSVTLIDIRRPEEWIATGIGKGAHPIDMRRDDFIEVLAEVAGPDKKQPIALICARGVRSARMSKWLSGAGFTQIMDVPEGMLGSAAGPGWLARALPVYTYNENKT